MIFACEDPEAGRPEMYGGGLCYVGNDIAARSDLWVAWVLEVIGDVLWTREVKVLKRASFAEQDATLDEIMNRYRVARLWIDQTGMGEKPVEDAKRRYGVSRVDGVIFSNAQKLNIATAGKARFEDRRLRIPAGDLVLRADLHKPQRVVGPTGLVRFVAERDADGHADRFWALMLACAAADVAPREYGYRSVVPKTAWDVSGVDAFARPADDNADRAGLSNKLKRLWAGSEEAQAFQPVPPEQHRLESRCHG